jgi:hypothetical protein
MTFVELALLSALTGGTILHPAAAPQGNTEAIMLDKALPQVTSILHIQSKLPGWVGHSHFRLDYWPRFSLSPFSASVCVDDEAIPQSSAPMCYNASRAISIGGRLPSRFIQNQLLQGLCSEAGLISTVVVLRLCSGTN